MTAEPASGRDQWRLRASSDSHTSRRRSTSLASILTRTRTKPCRVCWLSWLAASTSRSLRSGTSSLLTPRLIASPKKDLLEIMEPWFATWSQEHWNKLRHAKCSNGRKDDRVCWKLFAALTGESEGEPLVTRSKSLLSKLYTKKRDSRIPMTIVLRPDFTVVWGEYVSLYKLKGEVQVDGLTKHTHVTHLSGVEVGVLLIPAKSWCSRPFRSYCVRCVVYSQD